MIKLWNINVTVVPLGVMQAESRIMPTLENSEDETKKLIYQKDKPTLILIHWKSNAKLLMTILSC